MILPGSGEPRSGGVTRRQGFPRALGRRAEIAQPGALQRVVTSASRRRGLRREKPHSGGCLTMAAPACLIHRPGRDRLGNGVARGLLANQGRRRWQRLHAVFLNDPPRICEAGRRRLAASRREADMTTRRVREYRIRTSRRLLNSLRSPLQELRARAVGARRCRRAIRPGRHRKNETRFVGVPSGGGPDSPYRSNHNGIQPIPARSSKGVSRRRYRETPAGGAGFRPPGRGAAAPT